jgi:hypothetical protein
MTDSEDAPDGHGPSPPEPRSLGWLRSLANGFASQSTEENKGMLRLLRRVTRAQKIIVGASAFGVVAAVLATSPPLPPPVSWLQQLFGSMFGLNSSGADGTELIDTSSAYVSAVVLQWLLVLLGVSWLWLVVGWRMGKLPLKFLLGFLMAGAVACYYLSRTPARTLWGWILIAALAIAYLHYWRKGRFGYTRGTAAAIFSHLALICFFIALPLVLIEVLGEDASAESAGADRADAGAESAGGAGVQTERECSILEMTRAGCPGAPSPMADPALPLPAHDVRPITADGRIEVATNATSPAELRSLFDMQRAHLDPRIDVAYTPPVGFGFSRSAAETAALEEAARQLSDALAEAFGHVNDTVEVVIRCASVPELPGVDPVLATGWFALSDQGAQQIGLESTDDVLFETSDRSDCDPVPPPEGAITADEVIGAAEQARLEVTNARDSSYLCYALGCLQQTVTDQFTVTLWQTADEAQIRIDRDHNEAVAGFVAGGWVGAVAVANIDASFNIADPGLLVGPVTTVHLGGRNTSLFDESLPRPCTDDGGTARSTSPCQEAYVDILGSAAMRLEEATSR